MLVANGSAVPWLSIAGMGATGDLQPDPVPALERGRDRPEIKLDGMRDVWCAVGEQNPGNWRPRWPPDAEGSAQ